MLLRPSSGQVFHNKTPAAVCAIKIKQKFIKIQVCKAATNNRNNFNPTFVSLYFNETKRAQTANESNENQKKKNRKKEMKSQNRPAGTSPGGAG